METQIAIAIAIYEHGFKYDNRGAYDRQMHRRTHSTWNSVTNYRYYGIGI